MIKPYTVCATHRFVVLVGPGSLLDEYECPTCNAITDGILPAPAPTDPEAIFISKITYHHNGNCCCGSCDPYYCFGCSHYGDFCTCPAPPSLHKAYRPAPPLDTEPPF